jgi:hypothetical protein
MYLAGLYPQLRARKMQDLLLHLVGWNDEWELGISVLESKRFQFPFLC